VEEIVKIELANYLHRVTGAIRIPAGTPSKVCSGPRCTETIYFVGNKPVSIAVYHGKTGRTPAGIAPTETEDGAGISHFADCIDAPKFGSKNR